MLAASVKEVKEVFQIKKDFIISLLKVNDKDIGVVILNWTKVVLSHYCCSLFFACQT